MSPLASAAIYLYCRQSCPAIPRPLPYQHFGKYKPARRRLPVIRAHVDGTLGHYWGAAGEVGVALHPTSAAAPPVACHVYC